MTGLLLAFVVACSSRRPDSVPVPSASLSVAAARIWYEAAYTSPGTVAGKAAAGDSTTPHPWALQWSRAVKPRSSPSLVLVPLQGDQQLFAGKSTQGTRYLIVAQQSNTPAPTGLIVELLLQQATTPIDTAALFAAFYTSYRAGRPAAPTQGQGVVLFYSAGYHYLTGRRFAGGAIQPGLVRLSFHKRPPIPTTKATRNQPVHRDASTCTDWYQLNDDGSRTYITTTGYCGDTAGGGGTGGGSFGSSGDGGWGGSGGGGGGGDPGSSGSGGDGGTVRCRACPDGTVPVATLSPDVTLFAPPPPTHKIQNIQEHLKCFNKGKGATFSV
jgi:hypothetical protein